MSTEEDIYNVIFKAMQNPIRRRILRTLSEVPSTYTEIQRTLNIDNGLLNYHLDNMRDLLTKNDEESILYRSSVKPPSTSLGAWRSQTHTPQN